MNKKTYRKPQIKMKKIKVNFLSQNDRFFDSYNSLLNQDGVLLAATYCGNCLLAGTRILMTKGKYKKIEDVKPGDTVTSYDVQRKKYVESTVVRRYHHPHSTDAYYLINGKVKITGNHPVLVEESNWKPVADLTLKNHLMNLKKECVSIQKIETIKGEYDTFNLELNGKDHNFFAEEILVHNARIDCK